MSITVTPSASVPASTPQAAVPATSSSTSSTAWIIGGIMVMFAIVLVIGLIIFFVGRHQGWWGRREVFLVLLANIPGITTSTPVTQTMVDTDCKANGWRVATNSEVNSEFINGLRLFNGGMCYDPSPSVAPSPPNSSPTVINKFVGAGIVFNTYMEYCQYPSICQTTVSKPIISYLQNEFDPTTGFPVVNPPLVAFNILGYWAWGSKPAQGSAKATNVLPFHLAYTTNTNPAVSVPFRWSRYSSTTSS